MSDTDGENDTMDRGIFKILERKTHRILWQAFAASVS